jgi:hypothetical protein
MEERSLQWMYIPQSDRDDARLKPQVCQHQGLVLRLEEWKLSMKVKKSTKRKKEQLRMIPCREDPKMRNDSTAPSAAMRFVV